MDNIGRTAYITLGEPVYKTRNINMYRAITLTLRDFAVKAS